MGNLNITCNGTDRNRISVMHHPVRRWPMGDEIPGGIHSDPNCIKKDKVIE